MKKIKDIAKQIGIPEKILEYHGGQIAKIDHTDIKKSKNGKLILVTAITPTRFGEGKTTMSIGLSDALSRLGKKTILCLREPSLGPVFSQKGGAAGGGKASVEPAEDINLHFTGDIHAITSAHNLISAEIDNHIFWGNRLKIKEVFWKRAIDLCDRALRKDFLITAASEVMAVFCLASDIGDLRKRLENIVIGMDAKSRPVSVKQLDISDNLIRLLGNALKPNLVQTAEGTPAFIHGGPFANIAHGTNSLIATKMALKLADYAVTEAGFGSDLGGFKFFDLITRIGGIKPNAVVIVATTRAIKETGLENIGEHIRIMKRLGAKPVVVINKFKTDSEKEISRIIKYCAELKIAAIKSDAYERGGAGSLALAKEVLKSIDPAPKLHYVYKSEDSIYDKASRVNREIFGGNKVSFAPEAKRKIGLYNKWGYGNMPVCIAKTQYSLSDDKSKPGIRGGFDITVTDVRLSAGAGFVVLYCGSVLVMPGMPKK